MNGYNIPGEVYAWTAVLVLPINSALNPFLYTFSVIMNKKVIMFILCSIMKLYYHDKMTPIL